MWGNRVDASMIPGARDLLAAYPHKDHSLTREVDISFLRGEGCWFSAGRYYDLVDEERGYWLCDARPDDEGMAMHIVMFNSLDDFGEALGAINLHLNRRVLESCMFISGAEIDESV